MQTKKLEVLVVEDTPEHIERARALAGEYNITVVETYVDGIKAIAKGNFDIVLSDYFIPWYTRAAGPLKGIPKMGLEAVTPQGLGVNIGLIAISLGVKDVGIVTDANHHTGVMAASIEDDFPHYKNLMPIPVENHEGNPQLRIFYGEAKDWQNAIRVLIEQRTLGLKNEIDTTDYKKTLAMVWDSRTTIIT